MTNLFLTVVTDDFTKIEIMKFWCLKNIDNDVKTQYIDHTFNFTTVFYFETYADLDLFKTQIDFE